LELNGSPYEKGVKVSRNGWIIQVKIAGVKIKFRERE